MVTAFETRAFEAQDSLVELLIERQAIDDNPLKPWTIGYGLPHRRDEQHIWIDEAVENWQQGQTTSGLVSRAENFRLSAYIYSRLTGASAKEVREDIITASKELSHVVGSTPFLGGVVMYAEITGGEYGSAFADEAGKSREAVLRLDIGCSAHVA